MASSGTIKSWVSTLSDGEGKGAYYSFEWTSAYKSPGVTTVNWQLWARGRTSSPTQLYHQILCQVIKNGTTTTLFDKSYLGSATSTELSFKNVQKASGSFDVTHANDGSGSFQIYFNFACYAYTTWHATTETATLNTNYANYTITYNANGGSGAPAAHSGTASSTITLSSTVPTRSGYGFRYWALNTAGTGTTYAPGAKLTLTSNITLYAIWGQQYTVTYNSNGGVGTPPSNTTHYYGISSSLAINPFSRNYSVDFLDGSQRVTILGASSTRNGWNKNAAGTSTHYDSGASVTDLSSTGGTVTLYAQYINGTVTLPSHTKDGYRFLGWNTKSDGSGINYAAGTVITPTGNMSLYAQWRQLATAAIGNTVYIKVKGEWKISKN